VEGKLARHADGGLALVETPEDIPHSLFIIPDRLLCRTFTSDGSLTNNELSCEKPAQYHENGGNFTGHKVE
jgi:hypothetical protein